jgi:hypothetical protein
VARRQWLTLVVLATQEAEIRTFAVQSQVCKAGRVVQVVECMTSKHRAVNSNPSTTKKTKNWGLSFHDTSRKAAGTLSRKILCVHRVKSNTTD